MFAGSGLRPVAVTQAVLDAADEREDDLVRRFACTLHLADDATECYLDAPIGRDALREREGGKEENEEGEPTHFRALLQGACQSNTSSPKAAAT